MDKYIASLFALDGRTALVTGGTSGVGYMQARGLLMAGATVVIVGRNPKTCASAAEELQSYGDCHYIVGDFSTKAGIDNLAEAVMGNFAGLNVLINNAGSNAYAPLGEYLEEYWNDILMLNLKAPFLLTQALLPILKTNARSESPSHIINTGSIGGLVISANSYAYGPSKAAVHHMTKVLAKELAPENIRVNAISPGLFPTKMTARITEDKAACEATTSHIPVGRLGEADDLAGLVVYLASSRYMTGSVIALDGGMSL